MKKALYPGTFDPFTNGHLDVLGRACRVFDLVEVAVAEHPSRNTLFSSEERKALIEASVRALPNVTVHLFTGLIAEHAASRGAVALVRGIRQVSDFDYEFRMALANRRLQPDLESVFFMTSAEHLFTSASLVREIHHWGGDISTLVPPPVLDALLNRVRSHE